ncbi:CxC2 domain-containing protein [Mycena kentingensis (nom. inval.)]|nr:CxC2 domain-containing protein [Mycena kentingensis (nom. inval.)]
MASTSKFTVKRRQHVQAPTASQPPVYTFPIQQAAPTAPLPTSVDSLSSDGRRIQRDSFTIPAGSPVKRMRLDSRNSATPSPSKTQLPPDLSYEAYTMSSWEAPEPAAPSKPKRKSRVSERAMQEWLANSGKPLRVPDATCDPQRFAAETEWNGQYFERRSLKSLGLRIQLGHPAGVRCELPQPGPRQFLVLHNNGIHDVALDFCGCHLHADVVHPLQLLRARLYPATTNRPQTCATLSCLDAFDALSLHAKTSAYDFYAMLEYRTNAAGVKPPNRYKAFLRMSRQYRHLIMLKRGGRGHAESGAAGTGPGELAVRCPACPCPGVNLPEDWHLASPEDQFLYIVYIAIDACFRLKRRLIGNDLRDPGCGPGFAFLVEWEPYREYLKTITKQVEMTSCSGLAALDHANTKFSRGYSATGVGAGVCARHEFVQPNGVADLQRGERYGNMDYILASLLRHIDRNLRKVLSYDIACQWSVFLKERLLLLPPLVRLNLVLALCRFVVPKLHIKGHVVLCQLLFSLGVPGSGNTDGEGIERLWAAVAGLAAATKMSGHGARADALDLHWNFWNWLKYVGLPILLRRRLGKARVEAATQREAFEAFSAGQAEHVPIWRQMVADFEADGSKPNPYQSETKDAQSEAEVRKEMEQEEQEDAERGDLPLHSVGPSEFMALGLEIEEQQHRLHVQKQLKKSSSAGSIRLKPLRWKFAIFASSKQHIHRPRYATSKSSDLPLIRLPKTSLSCSHPLYRLRHKQWRLRIEWCKAYARARRWEEEVRVLEEEWRRYPLSLAHDERQWLARLSTDTSEAPDLLEGRNAYAHKQAALFRGLIARAETIRTEVWKGRGHRRGGNATSDIPGATTNLEGEVDADVDMDDGLVDGDDGDVDGEDDDEDMEKEDIEEDNEEEDDGSDTDDDEDEDLEY